MNEYLDINQLSQYLGIKKSTLYAKVSSGQIPHYKVDRLVRFKKAEIDAWMKGLKKETIDAKKVATQVVRALEGRDVDLDRIIENNVVKRTPARYKNAHQETRTESLKGGHNGTF